MRNSKVVIVRFALWLSVAVVAGCGGSTSVGNSLKLPSSASMPTLTVSLQPATVSKGSSATLSWNAHNATSVTIQGLGTFGDSGSVVVTPVTTTTYSVVANGPQDSVTASATVTVIGTPTAAPAASGFAHVVLVVEENHSYSSVIGNSAMPYLNGLASTYGLATDYYANTHPSIGNYFMLTTGQIVTNNDGYTGTVTADNIVRHLQTAGKTWKSYAEGLPAVGYTGGDVSSSHYLKHHNPFAYFSDVVNSSTEKLNLAPFTEFASDLQNSTLPNFSFVVPNAIDDAHTGTLQQADSWLQRNIGPVLASPSFQRNGLLIILFDESDTTDTTHGGGQVAAIVIDSGGKRGYRSSTFFQHQSTLRLIFEALGVQNPPGAAATAPSLAEFF